MNNILKPENIGWLYTKRYFSQVAHNFIESGKISADAWDSDKVIHDAKIKDYKIYRDQISAVKSKSSFYLKTTYPGLACGLGYKHELGAPNEFKLGLYFDYTLGLPCIPGSSIKGVLKHAFNDFEYIKYLLSLNETLDNIEISKLENEDIIKLKKDIFQGIDFNDQKIKTYSRDCFFDAEIVASLQENPINGNKFLADDYITCHQNLTDPKMTSFTEPNPVKFLKVRSNVIFQFKFRLSSTDMNGLKLTPKVKLEIFKNILTDLGVGAKTNVGYGQFTKVKKRIKRRNLWS